MDFSNAVGRLSLAWHTQWTLDTDDITVIKGKSGNRVSHKIIIYSKHTFRWQTTGDKRLDFCVGLQRVRSETESKII